MTDQLLVIGDQIQVACRMQERQLSHLQLLSYLPFYSSLIEVLWQNRVHSITHMFFSFFLYLVGIKFCLDRCVCKNDDNRFIPIVDIFPK